MQLESLICRVPRFPRHRAVISVHRFNIKVLQRLPSPSASCHPERRSPPFPASCPKTSASKLQVPLGLKDLPYEQTGALWLYKLMRWGGSCATWKVFLITNSQYLKSCSYFQSKRIYLKTAGCCWIFLVFAQPIKECIALRNLECAQVIQVMIKSILNLLSNKLSRLNFVCLSLCSCSAASSHSHRAPWDLF